MRHRQHQRYNLPGGGITRLESAGTCELEGTMLGTESEGAEGPGGVG
jgi:hypothetical protein